MQYVNLGHSGLKVSQVCLGGNSWGAAGHREWAAFDAAQSRPFFRRALDRGINFFDTADVYNAGESERIIGTELLSYVSRKDVVISTKVGMQAGDGPNDTGLGRKHVIESIDAALRRLGTDYVDLYHVHRLDGATPLREVMETLTGIVRSGKARYIAASTMPAYCFAQMLMLADYGGYERPIAMQNLYNLLQREEEQEMLPLCVEQGVGVIPYSPLARGILSGKRDSGGGQSERARKDAIAQQIERRPCDEEVIARLLSLATELGCNPSQVALAWLLHQPAVVAPVIGATRIEHIDEAAAAVSIVLTAEQVRYLGEPYLFRPWSPA